MPVADLLERAREVGLDVIAITDHNRPPAASRRALAERYGVRVIVGEEVKTAEGEVIGLFLEERIPPRPELRRDHRRDQARRAAIVYVPHPFDRLHTVPSRALLKANVADIDVVEVFNSRLAFPGFNEKAERFAERYRMPAAAGSDAHVLPGLGTALTGMDEFTGPDDFVEALAEQPHHPPAQEPPLPAVAQVPADAPRKRRAALRSRRARPADTRRRRGAGPHRRRPTGPRRERRISPRGAKYESQNNGKAIGGTAQRDLRQVPDARHL